MIRPKSRQLGDDSMTVNSSAKVTKNDIQDILMEQAKPVLIEFLQHRSDKML